jgi:uncharacterized damage-inducible protein DinB
MADGMPSRYRRWFDYEKDAHERVIASLASVPVEHHDLRAYRKAVDLLGHLAAARHLWLHRLGAAADGPAELFPEGANLPDVTDALRSIQERWSAYLTDLTEVELARVFEYRSIEGARFRNRVEDILMQLFGHSLYHRGQIATLVRAAGGEPAQTDFVFWTREPI